MSALPDLPCSELSEALGEDMSGSAPSERRILVVEQPGPWGRDAVAESGLRAVADELSTRAAEMGARIQVVRRSTRRYAMESRSVWLASVEPGARFLRRLELDPEPRALLEADLAGGGEPVAGPLMLVCTHSTRDPCCARRGLPLHRELCLTGADVWHSSHLGGHRFAATMACLPLGAWLGRVPAEDAGAVAAALDEGRLPLAHLRGRAGEPAAVQAAEIAVRRHASIERADDLSVAWAEGTEVRLVTADGRELIASVQEVPAGHARPLSCGLGAKVEDPARYLVELRG